MARIRNSTIQMDPDEIGIFGFGSLLSITSLEHTLGRPYNNFFCACTINGWRRKWNISEPNEQIYAVKSTGHFYPERILYLNIEQVPGQRLNGLLVFLPKNELPTLDQRENVYNRIDITEQINEYHLEEGSVYTYEGQTEHLDEQIESPKEAAVQQSYLDTIEQALVKLGPSFRSHYKKSTDPVPERLVIRDRLAR